MANIKLSTRGLLVGIFFLVCAGGCFISGLMSLFGKPTAAPRATALPSTDAHSTTAGKPEEDSRAAERQKIANAIAHHSLVRGMTIQDARASLGAPYSVTDAGKVVLMTWRVGDDYWSADFADGVATVVSHTRL